jgi:hypothetical protein
MWCELSLPDNADMDEIVTLAKKHRNDCNVASRVIIDSGNEMRTSYDLSTEEVLTPSDNNHLSTVQIYDGDELIFENDD